MHNPTSLMGKLHGVERVCAGRWSFCVALQCLLWGQDPPACIPHCMTQLDGQIAWGCDIRQKLLEDLCSVAVSALGSGPPACIPHCMTQLDRQIAWGSRMYVTWSRYCEALHCLV